MGNFVFDKVCLCFFKCKFVLYLLVGLEIYVMFLWFSSSKWWVVRYLFFLLLRLVYVLGSFFICLLIKVMGSFDWFNFNKYLLDNVFVCMMSVL